MGYITLARRCNELLQSTVDSKFIEFKAASADADQEAEDATTHKFFHVTYRILTEKDTRELAERPLRNKIRKLRTFPI